MKRIIFRATAALVFLGVNAQAAPLTFEKAHQRIFNELQNAGHLHGLTPSQYSNVTSMVSDALVKEFGERLELNLSKQSQHDLFLNTAKSVGSKIVDTGKKAAWGIIGVSKSIVTKVGPFLETHKDKFLALADKAIPTAEPVAKTVAEQIGVPVGVVKGMLGEMTPEEQAKVVKAGPKAVSELVQSKIAEM